MKIKLENVTKVPIPHEHPALGKQDMFCRTCGKPVTEQTIVTSYVCCACRHIVQVTDKYCSFCGESVETTKDQIEHHVSGPIEEVYFDSIKDIIQAKKGNPHILEDNNGKT